MIITINKIHESCLGYKGVLVGGIPTPLKKYEFVSWDYDIPNIWKNKKCSKPPTSIPFCNLVI